jgi:hypothetical protein
MRAGGKIPFHQGLAILAVLALFGSASIISLFSETQVEKKQLQGPSKNVVPRLNRANGGTFITTGPSQTRQIGQDICRLA